MFATPLGPVYPTNFKTDRARDRAQLGGDMSVQSLVFPSVESACRTKAGPIAFRFIDALSRNAAMETPDEESKAWPLFITDECIQLTCGARCPNDAISMGVDIYVIDPKMHGMRRTTRTSRSSVRVPPAECIPRDPAHDENPIQLMAAAVTLMKAKGVCSWSNAQRPTQLKAPRATRLRGASHSPASVLTVTAGYRSVAGLKCLHEDLLFLQARGGERCGGQVPDGARIRSSPPTGTVESQRSLSR